MKRQQKGETAWQILNYINRYVDKHKFAPTTREIGKALGIQSTSTTNGHIKRMEKHALLYQKPHSTRALRITDAGHESLKSKDKRIHYPTDDGK